MAQTIWAVNGGSLPCRLDGPAVEFFDCRVGAWRRYTCHWYLWGTRFYAEKDYLRELARRDLGLRGTHGSVRS